MRAHWGFAYRNSLNDRRCDHTFTPFLENTFSSAE